MAGRKSAVYGELQRTDGTGTPAHVIESPVGTIDKAGYPPERIDPLIASLITNAEMGSGLLLKYQPMLKALMDKLAQDLAARMAPNDQGEVPSYEALLMLAENISKILERLNKMVMQSVKAKDEATRLRTFLATGDVDDGGLAALGENQLKAIVLKAAEGWHKPPEETNGKPS